MADFLFELGLEEVPARMIAGAQAELQRRVVDLLKRERLLAAVGAMDAADASALSYSTPRRLAVLVQDVLAKQADVEEELLGPSAKIAFKDGVPTPAAEAFARKAGVAVGELKTVATAKGDYIAATAKRAGRSAAEVIAAELPKEIAGLYWAKSMYWRAGKPERFVRPVKWMVALLGGEVVPVEFGGVAASDVTYGHRILHGNAPVKLSQPSAYLAALESAKVLADVERRKQRIRKELDRVTRTVPGARWREDEDLVDTVLHLTEWPSVALGSFEPEYLPKGERALPEEVLVTVMRDHQKYFAVEDAEGRLAPYFLAVLNTEADEAGLAVIRHGNERVLRARLNDARFFWDVDQKIPLADRVEMLKSVTFQKDLGSYDDKSNANAQIVSGLGRALGEQVDLNAALFAARLAKTDLTCELVKEFTELQGVIGGLYALAQGRSDKEAKAIYWQYRPANMDDSIPPTVEGQLFGIADRMHTIAAMFSIGNAPTGSKDPFALRRAANAVIKILAESFLPYTMGYLCQATLYWLPPYGDKPREIWEVFERDLKTFFIERLEFYLRDVRGQAYDVVKAVLAAGADDVRDAVARAGALTQVRGSEDFAAVCAAFKRMKNILGQAREKDEAVAPAVDANLLKEAAEQALQDASTKLAARVEELRQKHEYVAALEAIATLRPQVDAFFDAVMVMAPEADVRANRLALLQRVLGDFSRIADFSEIVTAG
ncbi:MAG: glycine--tRNA ligase subunit beta [Acidobacteriaceae bacterium]